MHAVIFSYGTMKNEKWIAWIDIDNPKVSDPDFEFTWIAFRLFDGQLRYKEQLYYNIDDDLIYCNRYNAERGPYPKLSDLIVADLDFVITDVELSHQTSLWWAM